MPAKSTLQNERKIPPVNGGQASRTNAALPAVNNGNHSASASEKLRQLYASLLRCRMVQEKLRALPGSRVTTDAHELSFGREAIAVGATAELGTSDTVAASLENLAALLARGAPLAPLLRRSSDAKMCCHAPVVPDDPFNAGVGIALAHKLEQKKNVVVAFCAEPQPRLERWRDALKFAAGDKLPIVFVIENGISSEGEDQAPHLEPVSFMTRDHGFPGILVDGCDVVAVWRVAQEGIHRARIGSGPTLIDCRTDPARDPLTHMEHYMRQRNAWDEAWRGQLEAEIRRAIEQS